MVSTWVAPPITPMPRDWPGERCFVICGGESVRAQRHLIPRLKGRFVAVKHAVILRPDADVLFFAGEKPELIAPVCLPVFTGKHVYVRGRGHEVFPAYAKRIGRTPEHDALSDDACALAGYDAGTSALNLAYLGGATEIVMIGYDMGGGRWFNGEIKHYLPTPHESSHQKHMEPLPLIAEDAKRKGIRIVNVSPISRVECFERGRLEDFL